MRVDYEIDLCFIREQTAVTDFEAEIGKELNRLFAGRGNWYTEYKSSGGTETIVAEVKGTNRFQDEGSALYYLKENGSERFWTWLQGYHIQVEMLEGNCRNCGS